MTKKGLVILVLAVVFAAGGVFAQAPLRFSAGAGGFIGGDYAFFDATYADYTVA
jgi:hypothetical protein